MATEDKFKDTEAKSIYNLLVSKSLPLQIFKVPRFRRNFSWSETKIEQFWNDIYENYTIYKDIKVDSAGSVKNLIKSQYMFGPVVLLKTSTNERLEWRIIDGQQRLAAFTILFCVIRDIILDLDPPSSANNNRPAGFEEVRTLIEQYYKGKSYGPKLILNLTDRNFFQNYIQKQDLTPLKKIEKWKNDFKDLSLKDTFTQSQKRLMKTYEYFYNKITQALITKFEDRFKQLQIIENQKKSMRESVLQKITTNPGGYNLDADFFGNDWNGKDFDIKIPDTDEAKTTEKDAFDKINARKRGKKFDSIEDLREYKKDQKQKRLARILNNEYEKDFPLTKKNVCIQNLDELPEFLDTIITDNFVVSVPVNEEDDAYQIFETLNARGQTLSKSELVKNMCLKNIENDDTAKIQNERWNKIFDETIGETQKDDSFLRESLRSRFFDEHKLEGTSKHVSASIANLFRIIKEMITTEDKVIQYIDHLEKDALFIRQLNDPEVYKDKDASGDDVIALKSLDAINIRLPIITAYRRWQFNDEFRKFLNFIVKFHFRNRTIGQIAPGLLESLVLETAKMIDKKVDETTRRYKLDDIKSYLKENDIDDDTFKFLFNKYEVNNTNIAKYILLQIEDFLLTSKADVRPISNLTVEHILPEHPDKDEWNESTFFKDWENPNRMKNYDSFVDLIGNLTLLRKELNSALQNKGFPKKKKEGYDTQSVKLELMKKTVVNMSDIASDEDKQKMPELNNDINEWTANIIEVRTKTFSEMAVDIWDLSKD